MKFAPFDHALNVVQAYLADCADRENWGDPRAAELNELIRGCVESISVNRRGQGQVGDAQMEQEALRHAFGYLYERATQTHADDMTFELA